MSVKTILKLKITSVIEKSRTRCFPMQLGQFPLKTWQWIRNLQKSLSDRRFIISLVYCRESGSVLIVDNLQLHRSQPVKIEKRIIHTFSIISSKNKNRGYLYPVFYWKHLPIVTEYLSVSKQSLKCQTVAEKSVYCKRVHNPNPWARSRDHLSVNSF